MRIHAAGARWRAVALLFLSAALVLSACSGGSNSATAPEPTGIAKPAPASAKCQAVELGPVTRCENLYRDFWPTINANLDRLYQVAKKTDGGKIVVWDWYPIPKSQIDAFTKRFPGLSIETRGLNFNLASAIITAHSTGAQTSDILKGSITTMTNLYDQGYWDKIDWTSYGVPKELLGTGGTDTGLLADSIQGVSIQYNTGEVSSVPTRIEDFLAPEWHGKLVTSAQDGYDFTGYGMTHGQAAMVQLIKQLRSSGNLTVSSNASTLLASGDKPVLLDTDLTDTDPALKTAPIAGGQTWTQFIGVNKYATNKPGATLFALWDTFDPSWLTQVLHGALPGAVTPYLGLPTATLAQVSGVMGKNLATLYASIKSGNPTFESFGNRDKLNSLLAAADAALS